LKVEPTTDFAASKMPPDQSSETDPIPRAGTVSALPGAPTPEEKLSGEMLMLTTGFMMCASALWLAVHSTWIPVLFNVLSVFIIGLYWKTRRLQVYAVIQLGLILFAPFAMQWSIGNFVTASGVSLWGLMAPVGAVTVLGTRNSLPWFFAWLFMTVMAGVFDFLLSTPGQRFDQRTVSIFFVLNFATISIMIYLLLWYFVSEKHKLSAQVEQARNQMLAEKDRSEKLLLNILPPAIAERLKHGEVNIAQGHADVTVMFADIVGFTRMTEELSPVETVKILNDVFSIFDELADKHNVEKIKTIGDAYMAAAGLDAGAQIHYADAIARMALEMQEKVADYRKRTGERIEIRIGIGTGPVVAGVIGKKKFIYDMWGDTVNVAFRMAADAYSGAIQVDLTTHRRLHNRFRFDEVHEVEIKGKGRMQVFHLIGPLEAVEPRQATA
jgi:adenylate cyclase